MKAQSAQREGFSIRRLLNAMFWWTDAQAAKKMPSGQERKAKPESSVGLMFAAGSRTPTQAQRSELESLCDQLFKKKGLIISGKLQLLGLSQVKKRMGKNWDSLRESVYDTVETVMKRHMVPGDFFVRYKDDTYLLIFASADFEEGSLRTAVIAEEIRKALFQSTHEAVRHIGVAHNTGQSRSASLSGCTTDKAFDILAQAGAGENPAGRTASTQRPEPVRATQVNAGWRDGRSTAADDAEGMARGSCSYFPLWKVADGAIMACLCHQDDASLQGTQKDCRTLEIMAGMLAGRKQGQARTLILCPVSYKTLAHRQHAERYLGLCKKLLAGHCEEVAFMVTQLPQNPDDGDMLKALSGLKAYCKLVCIQLPFNHKGGFDGMAGAGMEGIVFDLPDLIHDEAKVIKSLTEAATRLQNASRFQTFVTNVTSRSVLTSLTCMGFDYLGGAAIHQPTPLPVEKQNYGYEQMLASRAGK